MFSNCFSMAKVASIAMLAVLPALGWSQQSGPGQSGPGWDRMPGSDSGSLPWNVPGYRGYNEAPVAMPSAQPAQPERYQLYVTTLPQKNQDAKNAVSLMAHVPENAELWIEGQPTTSKGMLRNFQSPPLASDHPYTYTVRMDWVEDGKRVSQTQMYPVQAGDIQCVYLMHGDSKLESKAEVSTNLAKLSPEDRKLAEEQKFCAVQDKMPLGAMGVPFKVIVNGEPVMLCCEACSKRAQSKPEQTLAKVKEMKEKVAAPK